MGRDTDLIFSVFLTTQNFVKTATKFGENELELLFCDRFLKKRKKLNQATVIVPRCGLFLQGRGAPSCCKPLPFLWRAEAGTALALGTLRPAVSAHTGLRHWGQGPWHPALPAPGLVLSVIFTQSRGAPTPTPGPGTYREQNRPGLWDPFLGPLSNKAP